MKIIISPAKKMVEDDSLEWRDLPELLPKTEMILKKLRSMTGSELKKLWKCNDQIAALNIERLQKMDLHGRLTPAVLAYDGIQYQYMAPGVFSDEEYAYLQQHLRILSGFYGILRPFDGVTPYRLEMQAKLPICEAKNLYSFWGSDPALLLAENTDHVIDLASKEYSIVISRHLPDRVKIIRCVFAEESDGKLIEKGTVCKMARGEMVRFMTEHRITNPDELKMFDRQDYHFSPEHSDEKTFVFLRGSAKK